MTVFKISPLKQPALIQRFFFARHRSPPRPENAAGKFSCPNKCQHFPGKTEWCKLKIAMNLQKSWKFSWFVFNAYIYIIYIYHLGPYLRTAHHPCFLCSLISQFGCLDSLSMRPGYGPDSQHWKMVSVLDLQQSPSTRFNKPLPPHLHAFYVLQQK